MSVPDAPPEGVDPAVWIAGQFAEFGVTSIEVVEPGRDPRVLPARVTDLPGVVRLLGPGSVLVAADRSIRVEIGPGGQVALHPG